MKIEKNIKENLNREDLIELLNKQEQTIKSLEQNENKYESLFEDSLDGIYKSTLEGAFLDVNTALVNMLGYNTKEELLAIDINTQLYFNSKERKSVLDNINDLEIQRYCIQKKDGSTIWVEDYGKIETNEKGEFLYYKGIIRNVTDFKREIDIKKILLRIYQKGYDLESFEELNRFILSQLSSLLDVSNAYIAFYNEKKETINIPFISGEVSEREFPVGKSMTGYLMRGKVPLLVKAEKYRALIDSGEINLLGVFPKVWMGAPLIIDSKVIGAIVIQSYTDENAYNQQDLDLLEFVSTYISSEILRNRKKFELRKFSLAVEQSANTIVITNTEGEIEYVNAKFTEITGYTKEEAIGANPRILNSGNQDKAYYSHMWKTISSGKEWVGEFQNVTKSGKLFWERAAITSIKDSDGVITNYMAVKEEITLQKETEEKLKKATNEIIFAKEVLRKVLDNIPIKVFWKDLDSKFLGVNATSLKEMNIDDENEVIGKSDFDFHNEKWAQKYKNDELAIMKSGVPKLNYIETQIKNGKELSYISNKLPFFDENNNVIGIIGTSEDITEKLDYENKLKQVTNEVTLAKEVLRKVLDNIPVKVFWKNKELKFLGCNDAFLKDNLFKNEEEIIGKSDFDFNNKKDAETYRKDDLAVMLSGKPKLNFQHSNIKNGKRRWITTSKLPFFDENNNVIGIIGTSEDITERRENEVKLKKATEEAISANLSKSTFLSNMSHEIRTPMNAILGYSQLLQEDDNLTKPQQDNLKTINTSGEHLLSLINDILDMSKIEAGRVTLNLLAFNFLELLKEIQQLFIIKASQKKLQLLLNIDKNVPKSILGDESKIKQVIINLVGNAIKFTTTGFVEIFVSKITDKKLQVSIKDSGKGILKEEHELVFKPFEQALGSSKFREGTGLGLAISKKFSNLMNGDIALESEFGKGSIFSFSFEFEEGIEAPLREDLEGLKVIGLSEKSKDIKIAIVDDRFENRDILFQKLNPLGFEIKMAENGQEAVDLYKNWKPDIILMDVVMPIMNGVEATRKILEIAGEHKVKIFVVSASALESEQKEIMDLGAAVFIKKPVIFNMLLSEMEHKGGVEFIYSAEKTIKKKSQIKITPANVPLHIKHKMVIAAEEGDFVLLQNLLENLETETNNKFEFLENCINEMEFEEVINWFES